MSGITTPLEPNNGKRALLRQRHRGKENAAILRHAAARTEKSEALPAGSADGAFELCVKVEARDCLGNTYAVDLVLVDDVTRTVGEQP